MQLNKFVNGNTIGVHTHYNWKEIRLHSSGEDKWIVINGYVYNISRFAKKHPGGARIISHFAGQDATDAWTAMHIDSEYVSKFMQPLLVGKLHDDEFNAETSTMVDDFRALRRRAEDMGLFHSDVRFFVAHLAHILLLEVMSYFVFAYFGVGWLSWLAAAILLTTSQIQAGWSQHDYGHLSVLPSSTLNHLAHHFVIGHLKGASSHWWNFRHNQHHVKPNVISKDPDVATSYLFVLGDDAALKWGRRRVGFMPYDWQHWYFWIIGPPILLPIYFHLENIYFILKRKDWWDLLWVTSFHVRFVYVYSPFLGGALNVYAFYLFIRLLESFWFVFVTQSNHIPMHIAEDDNSPWFSAQTSATCNVAPGWFNDWFTGHLNFQLEHHFFPTMPRHNYAKVAPLVRRLCEKHHKPYIVKPLWTAFADILRSLKKSGKLWYQAYHLT